jgi:hypothetical protein
MVLEPEGSSPHSQQPAPHPITCNLDELSLYNANERPETGFYNVTKLKKYISHLLALDFKKFPT